MSRIFHPCIFDRPVFSCLAFSVAPYGYWTAELGKAIFVGLRNDNYTENTFLRHGVFSPFRKFLDEKISRDCARSWHTLTATTPQRVNRQFSASNAARCAEKNRIRKHILYAATEEIQSTVRPRGPRRSEKTSVACIIPRYYRNASNRATTTSPIICSDRLMLRLDPWLHINRCVGHGPIHFTPRGIRKGTSFLLRASFLILDRNWWIFSRTLGLRKVDR